MGILDRFTEIIKANINDLLDKAEDPAKMIDQYLRELADNLADVKEETASVMAEEARTKRLVDANDAEIDHYTELARRALKSGNEGEDKIVALVNALKSEEIRNYINETYDGAVIPFVEGEAAEEAATEAATE